MLNLGFIFLQAGGAPGGGGSMGMILMAGMVIVFYFFLIRPQAKKQKEQRNFETALEKGTEVVTASGILGKINKIEDQIVTLEIATKVFIRVTKSAISKEMTESLFNTTEKNSTLARIKLQEDRAILMICIGIALVFWILVKLSQVYRVWKPASINVNVPEEMAFTKMPPNNLMLRFEARGWDLLFNSHNLSRLALHYDMEEENELVIPDGQLRSDILENLPSPRIKVVDVNYNELFLKLEKKMERKVPIVLIKKIEFSEGFNYSDTLSIHPDSVTVSGPASLVETITFWKTDSLTLLNGKKTVDRAVSLFPPPRELHLSEASTMVKIPIENFTEKSFFIPLEIKNVPERDSLSIFPSSVNVSCVVGLSKYDDLTADKIKFEVDLGIAHLSEGKNTAPIVLAKYPDYVQTVKYTPKAATFFIIKKSHVVHEPPPGQ